MPWERPTLKQLYERIGQDFSGKLLDGSPLPQRSVVSVLTKVWAGLAHTFHGFLEWLYKQVFVDTAEGQHLERWGAVWGILRKPASLSTGKAYFTGSVGATIPKGTIVLHKVSGQKYATKEEINFINATVEVALFSLESGKNTCLPAGSQVSLISPIAAVQSIGTVGENGISGGADAETDSSLLSRLLLRLRNPPRGGAKHDYIAWALEVPGVTRAWCYPLSMGIGTVGLTFVSDNATNPIPSPELVQRVKDHIEPLRPASVKNLDVFAPEPLELTFRLAVTPNTLEVQSAVKKELYDLIAREGKPETTLLLSHIHEAISLAQGEIDHILYEPVANIEIPQGYFPLVSNIEFQGA